jgi:hypothetical protein
MLVHIRGLRPQLAQPGLVPQVDGYAGTPFLLFFPGVPASPAPGQTARVRPSAGDYPWHAGWRVGQPTAEPAADSEPAQAGMAGQGGGTAAVTVLRLHGRATRSTAPFITRTRAPDPLVNHIRLIAVVELLEGLCWMRHGKWTVYAQS